MRKALIFLATLFVALSCGEKPTPTPDPQPTPQPPAEKEGTFHVDESIVVDLGTSAAFGTSGHISIYNKTTKKKVDDINMADIQSVVVRDDGTMVPKAQITNETLMNTFMDAIGSKGGNKRVVHYTPIRIDGSTVSIKPHSAVLDYNTEYYVTIDPEVFVGYAGLGEGELTFKTVKRPTSSSEITVAPTGKADFRTLQGALNYAMETSGTMTIRLASGEYNELLFLRDRKNLTIRGVNKGATRIVYPNNEGWMNGSGSSNGSAPIVGRAISRNGGRSVFLVENCDNLTLENLTIENSFGQEKGQAECIYFNSGNNTHHLNVESCAFLSLQDTFLCKGICYVHNSLVAGHCDYIWGYPSVCLFEDCEIRSLAQGYIVQARVPSVENKGFIFLNCRLTSAAGLADNTVWLARSGGSSDYYDNVVFVGCSMCGAIRTAGWCTDGNKYPNPSKPTATAGWREYSSTTTAGTPITTGRNSYGLMLTAEQAAPYLSKESILE